MLPEARIHPEQPRSKWSVQLRIWRLDQASDMRKLERRSGKLCELTAPEHVLPMLKVSWVHPGCLLEEPEGSEHAREHSGLGSRLSGSIDRDLDGLIVGGHEDGVGVDGDGDGEAFAAPGSADEAKVTELGNLEQIIQVSQW